MEKRAVKMNRSPGLLLPFVKSHSCCRADLVLVNTNLLKDECLFYSLSVFSYPVVVTNGEREKDGF